MKILIGLLFAYLIYRLLEKVYIRVWNKKLTVEVEFARDTAVEGEKNELVEVITNQKFLPLPMLKVRFFTHKNITFGKGENAAKSDQNYRSDIFTLMPYQKITRILPFECRKRGFYTIEDLSITSSDPLMSTTFVENFKSDTSLLIYPKGVDFKRIEIPFSKMLGSIISNRFSYEDPFEFRTIRKYESFDSMRNINWKASARSEDLLVNAHNYTVEQEVVILLDLDSDTTVEDDGLKEESLQIAATLSSLFIGKGIPLGMVTNGRDMVTKEEPVCEVGCGMPHIMTVKRCLAGIDLSLKQTTFVEKFKAISGGFSKKAIPVLITPSRNKELAQLFFEQFPQYSVWIVTHRPNESVDLKAADSCYFIKWEVSY